MKKNLLGLIFLSVIFLGNVFGANSLLILNRSGLEMTTKIDGSWVPLEKNGRLCFSRKDSSTDIHFSFEYERLINIQPVERYIFFKASFIPEFGKLFVFKDGLIALLDENRKKDPIYAHLKVDPLAKHSKVIYLNEDDFIKKLQNKGYKKSDMFNLTEQEKTDMKKIVEGNRNCSINIQHN